MTVPGCANPLLMYGDAGGYQIERSLRFNSSDSAYLSRTPASAGNRKTWSLSWWQKLVDFPNSVTGTTERHIFFTGSSTVQASSTYFRVVLVGDNTISIDNNTDFQLKTTRVFRDFSAWYHFLLVFDTTQSTASDRIKLYINGLQETTFSTSTYPTLNTDYGINQTAYAFRIGSEDGRRYLNGYLADIYFIDGQALTPSSFTEVSATTGQLIPKAYTGSFGTNGFRLKFSDNSAATATTLGKDYSGNSNNWTPNNLSVTAGAGNDSLVDTPTSYGTDDYLGGSVRGNYCTWNPLNAQLGAGSVSNGNLDFTGPSGSANYNFIGGTFAIDTSSTSGWYFEFTQTTYGNGVMVSLLDTGFQASALSNQSAIGYSGTNSTAGISYANEGSIHNYGSTTSGLTSWTSSGDIISIAIKNNKIWFAKNGTWISGSPSAETSPSITLASTKYVTPAAGGINSSVISLNFGQRPFAYTAPSGFKALCTTNLPDPVVAKPSTVMDVKLYTGNGSTQTINGLGFSPDLVWTKARSVGNSHAIWDAVRGVQQRLIPNDTVAEATRTGGLTAFTSDGFTHGSDATGNESSTTYVAWCWDAGSSTVSNTQGSITSSCRTNQSSGFSVVTYSGTLSAVGSATVGHGLNVAPAMIISKSRNNSGADNGKWQIRHIGLSSWAHTLAFDTAQAFSQSGNGTLGAPTSTVFDTNYSVGINVSGNNYVAYCFAPVTGYSSFGSYTGNGSTSDTAPFVWTGFRPRWILLKDATVSGDAWLLFDSARDTYNVSTLNLYPNLSNAEQSSTNIRIDILSNGFKIRCANAAGLNANNSVMVYAAFAEAPFQYARAR